MSQATYATEEVRALVERLSWMTTVELDRSAERMAAAEKRSTAAVIAHIAEISRRGAHIALGYRNLFEYATRRLGFDEGAAGLRIHVAKASRRFPEVLAALEAGRVSLSVAALLVPHLGGEDAGRVLADCAGMTKREAQEYVVRLAPRPVYEPAIRRVAEATPVAEAPAADRAAEAPVAEAREEPRAADRGADLDRCQGTAPATTAVQPPGPIAPAEPAQKAAPRTAPRMAPRLMPATPEVFNFRFSAGREFRTKLERLAEVLNVADPVGSMGALLERAVDFLLERKDPRRRFQRRLARETRRRQLEAQRPDDVAEAGAQAGAARMEEPTAAGAPDPQAPASRPVPVALWDRVLERAGYRCEFRGLDGRRCTQRTGLEPDHYPTPFSRSRRHDEEGIRAHCAAHNRLTAERTFGRQHLERKIAEARVLREARASREAGAGRGAGARREAQGIPEAVASR